MPGGKQRRVGEQLARAYPPDRAADEALDRLIDQLGQVPWPKAQQQGGNDARH